MKKLLLKIILLFFFSFGIAEAQSINIGFCIDNNYTLQVLLTINAILKNNYSKSDYHFYIAETDLTDKSKSKIRKFVEKHNQQVKFIHIDKNQISKYDNLYKTAYIPIVSVVALTRVYLPSMLEENVKNIIYMDADILVRDDLYNLYFENLDEKVVGMVEDHTGQNLDKRYGLPVYYNTGVILINVKKWKEQKTTEAILHFLETNINHFNNFQEPDTSYIFAEQDAINMVLNGNIKTLSEKWNSIDRMDMNSPIIHFLSRRKPWLVLDVCLSEKQYYRYWAESEFKLDFHKFLILQLFNKTYDIYSDIFQRLGKRLIKDKKEEG